MLFSRIISVFGLFGIGMVSNAMGVQYVLDGGHMVSAYWNQDVVVQENMSRVNVTPEWVGYTVYLPLGCMLTRLSDGVTSYVFYPGLAVSGACDVVNESTCTTEVATSRAHENWQRNAQDLCWGQYSAHWRPENADTYYPKQ